MLRSAVELLLAMSSTGILWVLQMLRLFIYGGTVWLFFLPHMWWYTTSANIIRRVAYRSSATTKRRNFFHLLKAEGVDLDDLLDSSSHDSYPVGGEVCSEDGVGMSARHPAAAMGSARSDGWGGTLLHRTQRRLFSRHNVPRTACELDRLLVRLTALNVNPADGSKLRSIPRPTPLPPGTEEVRSNNHSHGAPVRRRAPRRIVIPAMSLPPTNVRPTISTARRVAPIHAAAQVSDVIIAAKAGHYEHLPPPDASAMSCGDVQHVLEHFPDCCRGGGERRDFA